MGTLVTKLAVRGVGVGAVVTGAVGVAGAAGAATVAAGVGAAGVGVTAVVVVPPPPPPQADKTMAHAAATKVSLVRVVIRGVFFIMFLSVVWWFVR